MFILALLAVGLRLARRRDSGRRSSPILADKAEHVFRDSMVKSSEKSRWPEIAGQFTVGAELLAREWAESSAREWAQLLAREWVQREASSPKGRNRRT